MSFFKQLHDLQPEGLAVSMRIQEKNGKLTISITPDSLGNIMPLIVTGTPDELDESYIEAIRRPYSVALGLQTNSNEFLKAAGKEDVADPPADAPSPATAVTEADKQDPPPPPAEEKKKRGGGRKAKHGPEGVQPPPAGPPAPSADRQQETEEKTESITPCATVTVLAPGLRRGATGTVALSDPPPPDGFVVVNFPDGTTDAIAIEELQLVALAESESKSFVQTVQQPDAGPTAGQPTEEKEETEDKGNPETATGMSEREINAALDEVAGPDKAEHNSTAKEQETLLQQVAACTSHAELTELSHRNLERFDSEEELERAYDAKRDELNRLETEVAQQRAAENQDKAATYEAEVPAPAPAPAPEEPTVPADDFLDF